MSYEAYDPDQQQQYRNPSLLPTPYPPAPGWNAGYMHHVPSATARSQFYGYGNVPTATEANEPQPTEIIVGPNGVAPGAGLVAPRSDVQIDWLRDILALVGTAALAYWLYMVLIGNKRR